MKRPLAARKAILSRPISIRNVDAKCDAISTDRIDVLTRAVLSSAEGRLVGIDVDNAGNKIELQKVLLSKLPGKVETKAA